MILKADQGGERLDVFLARAMENTSRSAAQKLLEQGLVTQDGRLMRKQDKTLLGAEYRVELPEVRDTEIVPRDLPLEIVYEDEDVLVLNKPKSLVVHPAPGHWDDTLVNALMYHCKDSLSGINGELRPGIVHRIDKDTSGLLVCAKSDEAHRGLTEQLASHSCTRQYRGVAFYAFKEASGTVDAPIGRDPANRLRMAVVPGGKRAVTHWQVSEEFNGFTEIRARLETGRTHQIRVHMASIHHPLLGDTVYGPQKQPYSLHGQMLHAEILGFTHPVTGQYMEFRADPPEEYLQTLEKLRNRK